jgi:hypothetical protein
MYSSLIQTEKSFSAEERSKKVSLDSMQLHQALTPSSSQTKKYKFQKFKDVKHLLAFRVKQIKI